MFYTAFLSGGGINHTTQSNPAFMATLPHTIQCNPNDPVVLGKTRLNIGNGYNNNTGIFTAPRYSGIYFFKLYNPIQTVMQMTQLQIH